MAQPVRSWLSALGLAHLAEPLFEANITTMVAVCKLKDGDLLSLGVKLPEERALLLDSIAKITSLNAPSATTAAPAAVEATQVRDTKDPKLMRLLLGLVTRIVTREGRSTGDVATRVVVDRIEKVHNDARTLVFKRFSSTATEQRLFFVPPSGQVAAPWVPYGGSEEADAKRMASLLDDGLESCLRNGPCGRGIYFPSELVLLQGSERSYRALVCDVALGETRTVASQAALEPFESCKCDSLSLTWSVVNKEQPMLREDLAVRSAQQVLPRFVVSFTVHTLPGAQKRIWVVSGDGSGDHRSINEALLAASPGDRIIVRPGTYVETLVLSKEVDVRGVGAVVLESAGSSPCLTMRATCSVSNVTVRQQIVTAALPADAMPSPVAISIEAGSPSLLDCVVQGQVSIKDAQAVLNGCTMRGSRGHGVHAMGKSTCLVEQCTIDTAEMCGVHIDAGCRGVLVNSSMASCKLNGLFFGDEASGVVNGCDVSSNGYPGIGIKNADPVVMHNRVHHNSRSGIVVSGGMPTLEDNNVFANGVDGVVVAEQATCVMQGNSIFDNRGAGLQVMSGGAPQVDGAQIYNNRDGGVCVSKGSSGHLSNCRIFCNGKVGVSIAKGRTVVLQGCEVFSNALHGVEVSAQADPKLLNNLIFEHAGYGIVAKSNSAPVVEGNELFACEQGGMLFEAGSTASVFGNTTHTNRVGVVATSAGFTGADLQAANNISDDVDCDPGNVPTTPATRTLMARSEASSVPTTPATRSLLSRSEAGSVPTTPATRALLARSGVGK